MGAARPRCGPLAFMPSALELGGVRRLGLDPVPHVGVNLSPCALKTCAPISSAPCVYQAP